MRFIIYFFTLLSPLKFIGQDSESGDSSIISIVYSKLAQIYDVKDTTLFYLTNQQLYKISNTGSYLTTYIKNDSINRIVASVATKKGMLSTEYFINNGQILFVYQTFEFFKEIKTRSKFRNFKGILGWESRYFFENEQLKYSKTSGKKEESVSYTANDLRLEKIRLFNFIRGDIRR